MHKVVIVDDEPDALVVLDQLAKGSGREVRVMGAARSVGDAVEVINRIKPHIVFIDIKIIGGTGFDVIAGLDEPRPKLIFTTAYKSFGIEAIKDHAIDYLIKPVHPHDFEAALDRAIAEVEKEQNLARFEQWKEEESLRKVSIPHLDGRTFRNLNEIVRCQADGNYTTFYLEKEKPIVVAKTLKQFEEFLAGSGFFRIHQSHLINLHHVDQFEAASNQVRLFNGELLPVARRKKSAFLEVVKMRLL